MKQIFFQSVGKLRKFFRFTKMEINLIRINYRPISLLPIFGKIMEKHIEISLRAFLAKTKLLSKFQFGFKLSHSTIDALLAIINDITKGLNNNEKSV